ncbi:MAG: putative Fe-S cluster assembly protein SufT [Gammaproteobacteria bacterium]
MKEAEWIHLTRDCDALAIPLGTPMSIPTGTPVQVMQTLGGHITVNVNGNLARIDRKDVDALGIDLDQLEIAKPKKKKVSGPVGSVNEEAIWEQLKQCYDPEIPVNIVDLGLIYECKITPIGKNEGNRVDIKMTLTAPGCGMGPVLAEDVKERALEVENVTEVNVELVFDPPWDREMMSDVAKLELGLF